MDLFPGLRRGGLTAQVFKIGLVHGDQKVELFKIRRAETTSDVGHGKAMAEAAGTGARVGPLSGVIPSRSGRIDADGVLQALGVDLCDEDRLGQR